MKERQEQILLAGCALAVVLAVGFGFGWPTYVSIPLAVVMAAGALLGRKQIRDRREQEQLRERLDKQPVAVAPAPPPPPPPQPEPNREQVSKVLLPSTDPDYRFVFSCTVCWLPSQALADVRPAHADPARLAIDSILTRATEVTAAGAPDEHVLLNHRVAAVLGTRWPDRAKQVVAWAEDVTLGLTDEDAKRLQILLELRKNEQVWERERDREQNLRKYLADDVLSSTGSAVVWWLARHIDQVEEADRLVGTLARLAAAANDIEVPQSFWHLLSETTDRPTLEPEHRLSLLSAVSGVTAVNGSHANGVDTSVSEARVRSSVRDLADRIFDDPDDDRRALFVDHVASVVDRFGGGHLAEEIRGDFGLPRKERPGEPTARKNLDSPGGHTAG